MYASVQHLLSQKKQYKMLVRTITVTYKYDPNLTSSTLAAVIARRVVDSPQSIGTMATIFPSDHKSVPGTKSPGGHLNCVIWFLTSCTYRRTICFAGVLRKASKLDFSK